MNSSVTFDSAISVTSSLCLPMSCSSRSNGPSKLVSLTVKRDGAASGAEASAAAPVSLSTDAEPMRLSSLQAPDQDGVLAALVEVGEQDRDGLADDPAAVGGHAVLAAQGQPCGLERQQLVGGDVDGDLLVVLGPLRVARRTAARRHGRL